VRMKVMNDMVNELEIAMIEEGAIGSVQSMALRLLRDKGISRSELAERMEVSVARVSQILADDPKNLSIKKAAVLFYHLGEKLVFTCDRIAVMDRKAENEKEERKQSYLARQSMKKSMATWSSCANDDSNEKYLVAV